MLVQPLAGWQSGHAAACKAVYAGSIPTPASKLHEKALMTHQGFFISAVERRLGRAARTIFLISVSVAPSGRSSSSIGGMCGPCCGSTARSVFSFPYADALSPSAAGWVPRLKRRLVFWCPVGIPDGSSLLRGGKDGGHARSVRGRSAHVVRVSLERVQALCFSIFDPGGVPTLWRIWIVMPPGKMIKPYGRPAEDPYCAWVFTIVCNVTRVAF